ncbi:5-formyltetrahydrofolate cyclo-ligase [Arthrobacter sp. CAN_A6]|uniref:5-formyltetrahydrofolate cyclo-ligase n=1 Tax=Arthrobacter sp. CAN_A6 TaxID=2787721 RepID=UPI0018C939E8
MSFENEIWDSKPAARTALRARRLALPASERATVAHNLAATVLEYLEGTAASTGKVLVAGYLDLPPEPPVMDLLFQLHAAGHPIVVPVCEAERQLTWVDWFPGVPLAKSRFGPLLEPLGPRWPVEALPELRFVLVPALAIDRLGNRIGQGGGYYDRMLAGLRAANPAAELVGVVHDHELLPEGSFPVEPFDVPLPAVFTPSGFTNLRPPEGAAGEV